MLCVHEHDRLGFGMLTVETALIHLVILIVPIATEKVSRIRSNIIWNRPIDPKFRNNLARMILQTKFTGKLIFAIQIIVRDQALIKLNVRRSRIISSASAEVVQNRITELLWQLRLRTKTIA